MKVGRGEAPRRAGRGIRSLTGRAGAHEPFANQKMKERIRAAGRIAPRTAPGARRVWRSLVHDHTGPGLVVIVTAVSPSGFLRRARAPSGELRGGEGQVVKAEQVQPEDVRAMIALLADRGAAAAARSSRSHSRGAPVAIRSRAPPTRPSPVPSASQLKQRAKVDSIGSRTSSAASRRPRPTVRRRSTCATTRRRGRPRPSVDPATARDAECASAHSGSTPHARRGCGDRRTVEAEAALVCTPNVEHIIRRRRARLPSREGAPVSPVDGRPCLAAPSRHTLPEKLSGSDIVLPIARLAAAGVAVTCSAHRVGEKADARLREEVGGHSGIDAQRSAPRGKPRTRGHRRAVGRPDTIDLVAIGEQAGAMIHTCGTQYGRRGDRPGRAWTSSRRQSGPRGRSAPARWCTALAGSGRLGRVHREDPDRHHSVPPCAPPAASSARAQAASARRGRKVTSQRRRGRSPPVFRAMTPADRLARRRA